MTEAQTCADLAAATTGPQWADSDAKPFLVLPAGYTVADLESQLTAPTRKRGAIAMRDAASFIALVTAEKTGATRLYGQFEPPSFKAVFNDHAAAAGWRDHTATYACPLSVEWKTWLAANKKPMTQSDFAQFIEDNLPDIVEANGSPSAAQMLEISVSLEAKKAVNFASGIRLATGETQFKYEEKIEGTAGRGQFNVPEFFTIGVPVFEGAKSRNAIKARLRYRINEGGLVLWYDLERPHKDLEAAVKDVWAEIAQSTGVPIFNGG